MQQAFNDATVLLDCYFDIAVDYFVTTTLMEDYDTFSPSFVEFDTTYNHN